jgi:L-glyceraldehyde 3-phosphate reductase
MFNRWIEPDLLDALEAVGAGCIAFSPLAQGLLTDRYLSGVPEGSRASGANATLNQRVLTAKTLEHLRALQAIAVRRGQTLAQMALAWVLRDRRVISALIGVSSVTQLEDCLLALKQRDFSAEELQEIDRWAVDGRTQLWGALEA